VADDPRARLGRELHRVAERLRSLGLARLERVGADGRSPAALAHETAQALADLAADARGRERRDVPVLPALALGDQVTVTGNDLLAEGDEAALSAGANRLGDLRRAL
jgi:hypothetical protein